jgi:hypothetical protein
MTSTSSATEHVNSISVLDAIIWLAEATETICPANDLSEE